MAEQEQPEDFFQRIKDVNWESEPEVRWMAGDGSPSIIAGQISGTVDVAIFTSDDGIHWSGTSASGPEGFNVIYGGGWMRENLDPDGAPVWVLLGGTGGVGLVQAASTYSTDGNQISSIDKHDTRHVLDTFRQAGKQLVSCISYFTFPNFHEDTHLSSNGKTWFPNNFHPIEGGASSLMVPTSFSAPSITPFASDTTQKSSAKVFVAGGAVSAIGKVRKGLFKGKTIELKISPYNNNRPAHGWSSLIITDKKTGEPLGASDCGVERTTTIAYGHYVFCVAGLVEKRGVIAYTEDGITWGQSTMNDLQVNVLAVGPRK